MQKSSAPTGVVPAPTTIPYDAVPTGAAILVIPPGDIDTDDPATSKTENFAVPAMLFESNVRKFDTNDSNGFSQIVTTLPSSSTRRSTIFAETLPITAPSEIDTKLSRCTPGATRSQVI